MELFEELVENPYLGTSLGDNRYKVRVAVKSKGKGKSGGVRVITYLITENEEIYAIDIYDKSERNYLLFGGIKVRLLRSL
jgi:mRNA-degrading endonuclease RelE of RelBE toxin-antitoxin system